MNPIVSSHVHHLVQMAVLEYVQTLVLVLLPVKLLRKTRLRSKLAVQLAPVYVHLHVLATVAQRQHLLHVLDAVPRVSENVVVVKEVVQEHSLDW